MANFVLVTGFGTGPKTAERAGAAVAEVYGGDCRAFTYGYSATHHREVQRAVESADECLSHSQGVEQLLGLHPAKLTAIAPPITHGTLRMIMGVPAAVEGIVRNIADGRHLELVGSGIGEMMMRGFVHGGATLRRHVGIHMQHKIAKEAQAGTETNVVQMAQDEIIPVLSPGRVSDLGSVRHGVIDGRHNAVLLDPHAVLQEVKRLFSAA